MRATHLYKRLAKVEPETEEMRRAYRGANLTTPNLVNLLWFHFGMMRRFVNLKQRWFPFLKVMTDADIIPGIKADTGVERRASLAKKNN